LANAVTYGCMIDACVKCGNLNKAVEIFEGMREEDKHRNTILYTTLIKGYGSVKDLAKALELFREMPLEGVPYTTITYNSIIDACIKCGDIPAGEGILREIVSPENSLEPDLITFSTLLKGYCHIGELDKALQVAEAIKARGMKCDGLVYNTLMDGCVKAGDTTVGIGLFDEMVQSGLRPTPITHSILLRLFHRHGCDEDASEAVAQLYINHGIERPNGAERMMRGKTACGTPGSFRSPKAHGGYSPFVSEDSSYLGGWEQTQQQSYCGGSAMQWGWNSPGMSPAGTPGMAPMYGKGHVLSIDGLLAHQGASSANGQMQHLALPADAFGPAGHMPFHPCSTTPNACGGSAFSTTPIGTCSPFMMPAGVTTSPFQMGVGTGSPMMMQIPPMPSQPMPLGMQQSGPVALPTYCVGGLANPQFSHDAMQQCQHAPMQPMVSAGMDGSFGGFVGDSSSPAVQPAMMTSAHMPSENFTAGGVA